MGDKITILYRWKSTAVRDHIMYMILYCNNERCFYYYCVPLFTAVLVSPLPLDTHTFYYTYTNHYTSRPLIFSTPAVFTAHLLYTRLSTNWLFTTVVTRRYNINNIVLLCFTTIFIVVYNMVGMYNVLYCSHTIRLICMTHR